MSTQLTISFLSPSPINTERFSRGSRDVFNHLLEGKSINRYQAGSLYKVGTLHSRIAEIQKVLKEQYGVSIERQYIKAKDYFSNEVSICEYWLSEESILKLKEQVKLAA